MKYWGLTYSQVMWGASYQNIILLNMSIPRYDDKGNKIEPSTQLTGKDVVSRLKGKSKQ